MYRRYERAYYCFQYAYIFLLGGTAQPCYQLGAREAHQLLVGGIVHATGPDPFGNCMPLPRPLLRTLCELLVTSFALVKDNFSRGFVVLLCLIRCLLSIESLTHILACLLYTSPSPRDRQKSRMPSSA